MDKIDRLLKEARDSVLTEVSAERMWDAARAKMRLRILSTLHPELEKAGFAPGDLSVAIVRKWANLPAEMQDIIRAAWEDPEAVPADVPIPVEGMANSMGRYKLALTAAVEDKNMKPSKMLSEQEHELEFPSVQQYKAQFVSDLELWDAVVSPFPEDVQMEIEGLVYRLEESEEIDTDAMRQLATIIRGNAKSEEGIRLARWFELTADFADFFGEAVDAIVDTAIGDEEEDEKPGKGDEDEDEGEEGEGGEKKP